MEKLMQYIWQHRLFDHTKLVTTDGRKLRIIDNGQLNTDSGPDFFNAKISIDGCVWAGNVEMHRRAFGLAAAQSPSRPGLRFGSSACGRGSRYAGLSHERRGDSHVGVVVLSVVSFRL